MVIKKVALLLIAFLMVNTAFADSYSKEEKTINFIVTPSISYRYDVFKYSIPHNVFPERKLSELTWKNYIIQPSIKMELQPSQNQFTFLGQSKYGYILKNSSEIDHDWHSQERRGGKVKTETFSKTKSSVKGNILDLSGAIGYSFNLPKNNLLTFYVGYDYTDYKNNNYGARQLAGGKTDVVIPFDQLIAKYYFKLKSPWIGLSVNTQLNDQFSIIPTIKLYSFKHNAKGYWLLRDDLKQDPSLKHKSKGSSLGFDIDFLYKYSDNLDFKINMEVKKFKMIKGKNEMFFVADPILKLHERVDTSKLFNLNLISYSISGGVRYKF